MNKTLNISTSFDCEYHLLEHNFYLYKIDVTQDPSGSFQKHYYGIAPKYVLEQFLQEPQQKLLDEIKKFQEEHELFLSPPHFIHDWFHHHDPYEYMKQKLIPFLPSELSLDYFTILKDMLFQQNYEIIWCDKDPYDDRYAFFNLNNQLIYSDILYFFHYMDNEHYRSGNTYTQLNALLTLQKNEHLFTDKSFICFLSDYTNSYDLSEQSFEQGFIEKQNFSSLTQDNNDFQPPSYNHPRLKEMSRDFYQYHYQLAKDIYKDHLTSVNIDTILSLTHFICLNQLQIYQKLNINTNAIIKRLVHSLPNKTDLTNILKQLVLAQHLDNHLPTDDITLSKPKL